MLQLYCGEGKGKTTAAVGLTVRAAGHGFPVVFAQFLKDGSSGERVVLSALPNVQLTPAPERMIFTFAMSQEERTAEAARQTRLFHQAVTLAPQEGLLVLDELCAALTNHMVPLEEVLSFLDGCPDTLEVVITGRNPPQALLDRAGYVTELCKRKHPYDQGLGARCGIEW